MSEITKPMSKAIAILTENDFIADGYTRTEIFKIITAQSYPLAGAIVKTGGRIRFRHSATKWKVTVGKRTICFYDVENGIAGNFKNFKTKDFSKSNLDSVFA